MAAPVGSGADRLDDVRGRVARPCGRARSSGLVGSPSTTRAGWWLYAWSFLDGEAQRTQAKGYLASLDDPGSGGRRVSALSVA